jgi:hypothetical protein
VPNLLQPNIQPGQKVYLNPFLPWDPNSDPQKLGLGPDTQYETGYDPAMPKQADWPTDPATGLKTDPFASAGGQKRLFPNEYFDNQGTYLGAPNPQSPDYGAQGSYFKEPLQWNFSTGKYEKPTNWEHVVGTAVAAGSLGMGLAGMGANAAGSAAGAGGSNVATAAANPWLSNLTSLSMNNPLVQGGIRTVGDAAGGNLGWKSLLNFAGAGVPAGGFGAQLTGNALGQKLINMGANQGLNLAHGGAVTPAGLVSGFANSGIAPSGASKYMDMAANLAGQLGYGNQPLVRGLNVGNNTNPASPSAGTGSAPQTAGQGVTNTGNIFANSGQQSSQSGGLGPSNRFANTMSRQLGSITGMQDQTNPNLAAAIGAGRMTAINNQPYRAGYDTSYLAYDPTTRTLQTKTVSMPPILTGNAGIYGYNNNANKRWNPTTGQLFDPSQTGGQ